MDNTLMQSIYRDLTELFKKESFQKLSKEEKDKQRDKLIKIATRGVFENIEELDAAQVAFKESQDGMRDPGYAENLRDGFRALMQGATLGFSDEIEAAVESVWSKVPYNVLLDIKRTEQQNFAKQNPNAALGLELAGGVASALIPAGGIARGGQAVQYGSKVLSNLLNPGSIAAKGVQGLGVGKTGRLAGVAKSPVTSGAVQGGVDAAAYNLGTSENIVTPDNPLSLQGQTQGLDVERLGTDTALGVGLGGVGGKVGQAVAGYVAPKAQICAGCLLWWIRGYDSAKCLCANERDA